jgi:hypothetical protein
MPGPKRSGFAKLVYPDLRDVHVDIPPLPPDIDDEYNINRRLLENLRAARNAALDAMAMKVFRDGFSTTRVAEGPLIGQTFTVKVNLGDFDCAWLPVIG